MQHQTGADSPMPGQSFPTDPSGLPEATRPALLVWATGYRSDYTWIHIPGVVQDGRVIHRRGVTAVPDLYFLGLSWQHTRPCLGVGLATGGRLLRSLPMGPGPPPPRDRHGHALVVDTGVLGLRHRARRLHPHPVPLEPGRVAGYLLGAGWQRLGRNGVDRSATWVRTVSGPDGTDHQGAARYQPPGCGPLPVAAVHDVVEWAPVGPLDRRERAVGGDTQGDQQGAEPVLGKA